MVITPGKVQPGTMTGRSSAPVATMTARGRATSAAPPRAAKNEQPVERAPDFGAGEDLDPGLACLGNQRRAFLLLGVEWRSGTGGLLEVLPLGT